MELFRIYTENKDLNKIRNILNVAFDGYTLIQCEGTWKGEREKSLIIEIILGGSPKNSVGFEKVKAIADEIRRFNNQQAVIVTRQQVDSELV